MIKTSTPRWSIHQMTLCAIGRETCKEMIGILRILVLISMATNTRRWSSRILLIHIPCMARITWSCGMLAEQWETSLLVALDHIRNFPRLR